MNATSPSLVRLPENRLLSVTGTDATSFLQAQLSRRVDNLTPEDCVLAGWHDASGKVRAVFRILTTETGYLIALPASLADQLIKMLNMFVLRADVRIEPAGFDYAGIVSNDAGTPKDPHLPALPTTLNTVARRDDVCAICVAPGCWHVIAPPGVVSIAHNGDSTAITAAEIRAGLPQVDELTTQRYVAQILNLDKLDAVDFEKGCYPGQEVIARTQHLGSVKRRAQVFSLPGADAPASDPACGAPLVNSNDERVGEVIRCATETDGSLVMLAVVTLAALDSAVYLESAPGTALTHHPLSFASDQ